MRPDRGCVSALMQQLPSHIRSLPRNACAGTHLCLAGAAPSQLASHLAAPPNTCTVPHPKTDFCDVNPSILLLLLGPPSFHRSPNKPIFCSIAQPSLLAHFQTMSSAQRKGASPIPALSARMPTAMLPLEACPSCPLLSPLLSLLPCRRLADIPLIHVCVHPARTCGHAPFQHLFCPRMHPFYALPKFRWPPSVWPILQAML